jgi:hypothetical protein
VKLCSSVSAGTRDEIRPSLRQRPSGSPIASGELVPRSVMSPLNAVRDDRVSNDCVYDVVDW